MRVSAASFLEQPLSPLKARKEETCGLVLVAALIKRVVESLALDGN